MINENAQEKDFRDKYVFWNIDGTLASYRFNGHVDAPDRTDNDMSLKEIEDNVFLQNTIAAYAESTYNM